MTTRRVGAALVAVLVALSGLVGVGPSAAAGESAIPFRIDPSAPFVAPGTALEIGKAGPVRLLRPAPLAAARHAKVAGSDASLAAVTCYVGASGPRRTDSTTVYFGVDLTCNGAIRKATMYLYVFYSIAGTDWSPFASRGPDSAVGTPFIVGLSRTDGVCLPAHYIGVAHVIVDFVDGYPLHLEGVFQTPSVFVGC